MKTPIYLFYKERMAGNYYQLKQRLPSCDIHYALKANSEIEILTVLKDIGLKFDVASTGEFLKLIKIGVPPEHIICTLPVKSEEMIETLYRQDCRYFVFEHIQELIKLDKLARQAKKILRIYNADIIEDNIEYGMTIDEFQDLKKNFLRLFEQIDGITFFVRNPNNSASDENLENMLRVLDRCDWFLGELDHKSGLIFNIGGNYRFNKSMNDAYYDRLNNEVEKLKEKYQLRLLVEPGRAIIDSAGVLLTKVVMTKERQEYHDVFIDAGDPTGLFTRPTRVTTFAGGAKKLDKRRGYRFIGTTCSHRILFSYASKFEIQKGDILMLEGFGAYSICYSSNFHAWERPGVIIQ
ncbi:hypothetical protein ACFLRT_02395 [Acidobacteriota bacterium]